MILSEVTDAKCAWEFIRVAIELYRDNPYWIRPLDKDIEHVFDRHKNKLFHHGGKVARWVLKDNRGKLIGRVMAFVNPTMINANDYPTGGMGLFECINDQKAANLLFNTCKAWLQEKGMEAMDGPINFGERNFWWGCLVEGFDREPLYGMNYNPPYYKDLFENYGFKLYYRQFSYGLDVNAPRPKKYYERAEKIMQDKHYRFEYFPGRDRDQFIEDYRTVYNEAWAKKHGGFKEMSREQAFSMFRKLKNILVPDLIWVGYYDERPIVVFLALPDLNQYFKHVNGKLDWLGKLKFTWLKLRKKVRKLYGVLFGIVPDFQGIGVEGAMIMAAHNKIVPQKRWDWIELSWIGDFSPKMLRIAENLGCERVKTHITYEYLFDQTRPFKRYPILG